MKWWEAGTVVVEVSGYESCTDRCSHGTSQSDLTRRRLSERLCHSEAKPCQRTGERSAKLRACIGSCLFLSTTKDPHKHSKGGHPCNDISNLSYPLLSRHE